MAKTSDKMKKAISKRRESAPPAEAEPVDDPGIGLDMENYRERIELLAPDAKDEFIMDLISAYMTPAEVDSALADLEIAYVETESEIAMPIEQKIPGMPTTI